jgi:glycosyltransferase 2 family protein
MGMPTKDSKFLWIRLTVGLMVLAVVLARINVASLLESAHRCSPWLLIVATISMSMNLLIAAKRWKLACGNSTLRTSYWRFYAWYMEAAFFNIFLPSQGGDLMRIWRLADSISDGALAMSTVLAERVLGLAAMIFLAGAGLLFSDHGTLIPGIRLSFLMVATATAIGFACLFHPALSRIVIRFCIQRKWLKAAEFINKCAGVMATLAKRPGALAGIVLYSWAMQLTTVTAVYLIGRSIFINIPFVYYLVVVPIVWVAVMVPVSLNGIGTREAANVALFGTVGVPAETALLLSIIWSGQIFLIGLIGGFFHLWLTAAKSKHGSGKAVFKTDSSTRMRET